MIRKLLYLNFAKLFTYPDNELVKLITSESFFELFEILNVDQSDYLSFKKWIKSFKTGNELLEKLQVEYTGLFINSFPTLPAPLYKSFYEDKELLGPSIGKLLDTYEKYGVEISEEENELPDHLALMLEFVFRLEEEGYSREEQNNFVKEFIFGWNEELENKIKENAETDFYKFLITSLNRFLKEDVNKAILTL